jgi:hypothetical protein
VSRGRKKEKKERKNERKGRRRRRDEKHADDDALERDKDTKRGKDSCSIGTG